MSLRRTRPGNTHPAAAESTHHLHPTGEPLPAPPRRPPLLPGAPAARSLRAKPSTQHLASAGGIPSRTHDLGQAPSTHAGPSISISTSISTPSIPTLSRAKSSYALSRPLTGSATPAHTRAGPLAGTSLKKQPSLSSLRAAPIPRSRPSLTKKTSCRALQPLRVVSTPSTRVRAGTTTLAASAAGAGSTPSTSTNTGTGKRGNLGRATATAGAGAPPVPAIPASLRVRGDASKLVVPGAGVRNRVSVAPVSGTGLARRAISTLSLQTAAAASPSDLSVCMSKPDSKNARLSLTPIPAIDSNSQAELEPTSPVRTEHVDRSRPIRPLVRPRLRAFANQSSHPTASRPSPPPGCLAGTMSSGSTRASSTLTSLHSGSGPDRGPLASANTSPSQPLRGPSTPAKPPLRPLPTAQPSTPLYPSLPTRRLAPYPAASSAHAPSRTPAPGDTSPQVLTPNTAEQLLDTDASFALSFFVWPPPPPPPPPRGPGSQRNAGATGTDTPRASSLAVGPAGGDDSFSLIHSEVDALRAALARERRRVTELQRAKEQDERELERARAQVQVQVQVQVDRDAEVKLEKVREAQKGQREREREHAARRAMVEMEEGARVALVAAAERDEARARARENSARQGVYEAYAACAREGEVLRDEIGVQLGAMRRLRAATAV